MLVGIDIGEQDQSRKCVFSQDHCQATSDVGGKVYSFQGWGCVLDSEFKKSDLSRIGFRFGEGFIF